MKLRFFFVVLMIMLITPVTGQNGMEPTIVNNNPNFIEEFINPIILNWTVTDDNLRSHLIYQNEDLIDTKSYNFTEVRTIDITLQFNLGNGEYNFTLLVRDGNNNSAIDSFNLLKGDEVDNLIDLSDLNHHPYIITSFMILILIRRIVSNPKYDNY